MEAIKSDEGKVKFVDQVLGENLGEKTAITSGFYEFPLHCEIRDLDWNHLDQGHRPWIHKTYRQSLRLSTGKQFATSLTKMSLLGIPFYVLVSDVQLAPGLFFQGYTLFSLIYIHTVIRADEEKVRVEWQIVSPRFFKFLHGYLNRRLLRLNSVQNLDDVPIRVRRKELRELGYTFKTDKPDFFNSNSMGNNTIYPPIKSPHFIPISEMPEAELKAFQVESIELLLRRESDGSITAWPGACPHEGAPLKEFKACKNEIQCEWHGLKFSGMNLSMGTKQRAFPGGLLLSFGEEGLSVSPKDVESVISNSDIAGKSKSLSLDH